MVSQGAVSYGAVSYSLPQLLASMSAAAPQKPMATAKPPAEATAKPPVEAKAAAQQKPGVKAGAGGRTRHHPMANEAPLTRAVEAAAAQQPRAMAKPPAVGAKAAAAQQARATAKPPAVEAKAAVAQGRGVVPPGCAEMLPDEEVWANGPRYNCPVGSVAKKKPGPLLEGLFWGPGGDAWAMTEAGSASKLGSLIDKTPKMLECDMQEHNGFSAWGQLNDATWVCKNMTAPDPFEFNQMGA